MLQDFSLKHMRLIVIISDMQKNLRHIKKPDLFFPQSYSFSPQGFYFLLFTKETKQYDNMMKDG